MANRPTHEDPAAPRVARWLVTLLRPVHRVFMRLYFRVTVTGREHIPASGPVLLVPTHRSRWDTFLLACATGRELRYLASHDEFVGLQGWFMRRMGAFPVNTKKVTPGVLRHCREVVAEGGALVIFPEGDIFRLPPGEVHPLKPGVAWLALGCRDQEPPVDLVVVPIRLNLADRFLRLGSRAEVEVRPPIRFDAYAGLDRREAIERLTADLQAALGDSVNETPKEALNAPAEGVAA